MVVLETNLLETGKLEGGKLEGLRLLLLLEIWSLGDKEVRWFSRWLGGFLNTCKLDG